MNTQTNDTAADQARAQFESLTEMMEAFYCDFERMEQLRDTAAEDLTRAERAELAELTAQAGDCTSEDDARQRIEEAPLSVEVRSDWTNPGTTMEAGEFRILLCTGGPAVQIRGELDRGEPVRAWLEYQDWGTPWTQYFKADSKILCAYASFFFCGE